MKRIIAFVLSLILAALVLGGCGKQADSGALEGRGKRFEVIDKQNYFWTYVDTETGVEWVWGGHTFLPVIDSYGNPYIYPGFDAREDRP